jgi:hypothetical protein
VNLLRNDRVAHRGHPRVVIQHDLSRDEVELAEPGWDGQADGTWIPASEVTPLEQLTHGEVFTALLEMAPEQLRATLAHLAVWTPQGLVSGIREYAPDLLPERLRNGGTR